MSKETWIIEPRDPLIVRDGRPFGATAGSRAKSLNFPVPSTITGAARTRAGLGKINGDLRKFDEKLSKQVLNVEVRGPLLAEVGGDKIELLAPAPADCVIVHPENEGGKNRFPLLPLEKEANWLSDLDHEGLDLLGTNREIKGKPQGEPRYWHWAEFEKWLMKADEPDSVVIDQLGHSGLTKEQRTHVRILDDKGGYENKANSEGGLFQTRGLEFTTAERGKRLSSAKKLALVIEIDGKEFGESLQNGIAPLGGERRIALWRKNPSKLFPRIPAAVRDEILSSKSCRLILLTPAMFEDGFKPRWLKAESGLPVDLKSIAVNRPQVISGWNFLTRMPKPTRRMCPAGTVMFLKLGDGDIGKWIDETWFHCISDDVQDRKDGFGLAALGTWSTRLLKIEEVLKQ